MRGYYSSSFNQSFFILKIWQKVVVQVGLMDTFSFLTGKVGYVIVYYSYYAGEFGVKYRITNNKTPFPNRPEQKL